MRSFLAGSIVLLALARLALGGDAPSKADVAFRALLEEAEDKLDAAKTDVERKEVDERYALRFLDFAQKNAKDPVVFYALIAVVGLSRETPADGPAAKALVLLENSHVTNPGLRAAAARLGQRGDPLSGRVLRAVVEKSPDKRAQAKACKVLADTREEFVRLAEEAKSSPRARGALTKKHGRELVRNVLAGVEQNKKDAALYRKLYQDKFAIILPDLSVGKKAPEVVSKDLDGKEVKLSQYRGKVVVLDVWATWCGPCRAMIPHEREMVKKFDSKRFALVSISADARKETLTTFLKKEPMPWVHWHNGQTGGILEDWEVDSFPTIYVLDHKGVIRYRDIRGQRLEDAVQELLDEGEAKKGK